MNESIRNTTHRLFFLAQQYFHLCLLLFWDLVVFYTEFISKTLFMVWLDFVVFYTEFISKTLFMVWLDFVASFHCDKCIDADVW